MALTAIRISFAIIPSWWKKAKSKKCRKLVCVIAPISNFKIDIHRVYDSVNLVKIQYLLSNSLIIICASFIKSKVFLKRNLTSVATLRLTN